MYQEETYESNEDEAREAAQLADAETRYEYEAEEAHTRLWAGTAAVDYRKIGVGIARSLAADAKREAA